MAKDSIWSSLEKALQFIKNSRNDDGLWSDFLTLAGESVYWVSGYVGYAIARFCKNHETWLEEVALKLLRHQNVGGGWGYGPGVPGDADSTSWCLLFLSQLGLNPEDSENAMKFLLKHQNQYDSGFRTYAQPNEVARYMGMFDEDVSFEGWCSSQICVTAVAVMAINMINEPEASEEALDFIRSTQSDEGFWEPYWWNDKLYATFNCMKALKVGGKKEDFAQLRKAQSWILLNQRPDGGWANSFSIESNSFSTGLALQGLTIKLQPVCREAINKGMNWLVNNQLADGSWRYNYILRIPHPSVKEPWKQSYWKLDGKAINALIRDHNRLYSTATAFSALTELIQTNSKP